MPSGSPNPTWQPRVGLQTETLAPLLDLQNRQGDKHLDVLESHSSAPGFPSLLLGAQFRLSGFVGQTNTENAFPYLGRFPADFTGDSATDLRVVHANQGMVAHFAPWASGYVETLFSDVFTFPDFKQGSFQVRQAYVVFGDSDVSPFYAFLGKKNVSFGDMGTLSPFSQSVVWHYFAPLAEGAGAGFTCEGFNATITALNGSRGIRVVDSSDKGTVNNFAANVSYTIDTGPDSSIMLGGGYLHGTIYNAARAEHIDPTLFGPNNPAWDVHGEAQLGPLVLAGEYVQTVDPWPTTNHIVQAWRAEAALDVVDFGVPAVLSASWSSGVQGKTTDEFEFNNQLVIGLRHDATPNVSFMLEYIRSFGFAPLINITTVSNKSVRQNTILLGMVLAI